MEPVMFGKTLERLKRTWQDQADKPQETPESTLRLLWNTAAGAPLNGTISELDEAGRARLEELISRRLNGVPLAYLTGRQSFMGLDLLAGAQAMIPRIETEILGHAAIEAGQRLAAHLEPLRVLDLCTGSGNVALALAAALPTSHVTGADLSADAVDLAQRNALHLGLAERVRFVQSDLFAAFDPRNGQDRFHLITCNPPYIASANVDQMADEIRNHEPRLAFDGGPFGISVLGRLLRDAPRFAEPEAVICFEVGAGQGPGLARLVQKDSRFTGVQFFHDDQGRIRAIQCGIQVDAI